MVCHFGERCFDLLLPELFHADSGSLLGAFGLPDFREGVAACWHVKERIRSDFVFFDWVLSIERMRKEEAPKQVRLLLFHTCEDETCAAIVGHEAEGPADDFLALGLVFIREYVILRANYDDGNGAWMHFRAVFVLAPNLSEFAVERCDFARICLVQIFEH